VITEEDAKMFVILPLVPKSEVIVPTVVDALVVTVVDAKVIPLDVTPNDATPDDEAIVNRFLASPAVPTIETRDEVDVVPIEIAESQPVPIKIAVSVALPPVIDLMLRPKVVPVAAPEPERARLRPLNCPPAVNAVGASTLIMFWITPARPELAVARRIAFHVLPDVVPGVMSIRDAAASIAPAPPK